MKKLYVFGLCLLSGLLCAPARAQEVPSESFPIIPNIIISEINWGGSFLSSADEWIELYNASGESVDLSAWVLTGAATSGDALAIADGFIAAPQSTILIANYSLGNEKTTLNIEPNLVTTSLSLPNDHLNILLAMPDGTVVDQAAENIGSSTPAISMTRLSDGTFAPSSSSVNLLDEMQLGTPGAYNVSGNTSTDTTDTAEESASEEPAPGDSIVEVPVTEVVTEEPEPELSAETAEETAPAAESEQTEETEQEATIEAPTIEMPDEENSEFINEATVEPEPVVETSEPEPVIEPEPLAPSNSPISGGETSSGSPPAMEGPGEVNEIDSAPLPTEPTPEPEVVPSATFAYGSILINEIVSNPTDGVEWIELYNPGIEPIDLTNWSVKDFSQKETILEGSVLGRGYFLIENPKGKLNNDDDEVTLLDPSGNVIDQMSYGNSETPHPGQGESLSRNDLIFLVTTEITKGTQNLFPSIEPTTPYENDVAIDPVTTPSREENESEVIQDDFASGEGGGEHVSDDAAVHHIVAIASPTAAVKASTKTASKSTTKSSNPVQTITGTITALPGTFGTQIAFIDGVQLYFYDAEWPALTIGDVITVRGTPSTSHGEPRIKIANAQDIIVLRHEDVIPNSVTASSTSSQPEGTLITISGNIIEQDGETIALKDSSGTVTTVAHKNTGINWLDYVGSELAITGIVRTFDDGARLYPRSADDIKIINDAIISSTNEQISPIARSKSIYPWIGGGLAATSVAALSYWYLTQPRQTHSMA